MLYTHFITKFWKTFKIKTWSKIYVTRTWLSCHMLWLRTLLLLFGCLVAQSCPTLWTLWTVSSQAPLSMGFPRQEYWSGQPFPSSRESSWPRDWTWISHIAGRFFTVWATIHKYYQMKFCMFLFFSIFTLISFPDASTLLQASKVTPRNTWKGDQAVERDTTPKLLLSLTRSTFLPSSCWFNFCLGFLTTLNSLLVWWWGCSALLFEIRAWAGRYESE